MQRYVDPHLVAAKNRARSAPVEARYRGQTFYRTPEGAYRARNGRWLDRAVVEHEDGPIPEGWAVYHIDHCYANNDPDNLVAVPKEVLVVLRGRHLREKYTKKKVQAAVAAFLARAAAEPTTSVVLRKAVKP